MPALDFLVPEIGNGNARENGAEEVKSAVDDNDNEQGPTDNADASADKDTEVLEDKGDFGEG